MPSLIVVASIAFASALIEADSVGGDRWLSRLPWLLGVVPDGARQMLSTLAGSMMSVMGITFSMTLVALTLASSQYSSRILRNLMSSRITQVTLGIFAGTFAYCLVVLRTIRGGPGVEEFVPSLGVFFAFVLALAGIGVLVFFHPPHCIVDPGFQHHRLDRAGQHRIQRAIVPGSPGRGSRRE